LAASTAEEASPLSLQRGNETRGAASQKRRWASGAALWRRAAVGRRPKAGGPRHLYRFAVERTISTGITAAGGIATLLSLHCDG
jgi:hypothetical protein